MEDGREVYSKMKYVLILLSLLPFVGNAQLPVIIHETFDDNIYGWKESETDDHKLLFRDGKYYMQTPDGGWMSSISPYIERDKDFSIQATFTQIEGNENNGIGFHWGYDGKEKLNSFTFTSNGYYRIYCSDPSLNISEEWHSTTLINPLGSENVLKLEQKRGILYFYLNGNLLTSTLPFPWQGKFLGIVTYTRMHLLVDDFILAHDIEINLAADVKAQPIPEKRNLGALVNSSYDEVAPKISADGRTLYFGRKHSPQNLGGVEDKEDIWYTTHNGNYNWSRAKNMGEPVNSTSTNNLLGVSTDNNTLLFHTSNGFAFMHRTASGWTNLEDQGIRFDNESKYLEGSISSDGKAIIFVAKLKTNLSYREDVDERDIYICVKKPNGTWSNPIHTGSIINTLLDEYSPFLSADNKTLYFASNGRPGYGDVDVFMSRRIGDGWTQWTEPVNLGLGINGVGFDAYYTLPASGEYGYMVSNVKNYGLADIVQFKLPQNLKPEPVLLVSGKVLNARTNQPISAVIRFDNLTTRIEVGEARSDPATGEYDIALPSGANYGYHAAAKGYLSVNENLELTSLAEYNELRKDLYLVPLEVGESIQLKNVFFVQSKADLKPESYPELDRLVSIMVENNTMEIELQGHTDRLGNEKANLALSEDRVMAVKKYLVQKGIDPGRITGRGFGGSLPVAPSDSEEHRQMNRRVEFRITKK